MIAFSFKSHLIFAILLFLLISKYTILPLGLIGLIGCLLAFSLPDIDHNNSKISRKLPIISWIVTLLSKHRGVTHSLIALVSVFIVADMFGTREFANGVLIGYGSHLLADMFTPQGVPLFWFYHKYYRIPVLCKLGWFTQVLLFAIMVYYILQGGNLDLLFTEVLTK